MFERYTEKARRVIFFARYEASQFGAPAIEPEHLLLGIIREDRKLTKRFFSQAQASIEAIRKEIEGRTPVREKISTSVELPLALETKRVLEYAHEESLELQHAHIGTEHLLLGLLREERSVAAEILYERGLRPDEVREEIAGQPDADAPPSTINSTARPQLMLLIEALRGHAHEMLLLTNRLSDELKAAAAPSGVDGFGSRTAAELRKANNHMDKSKIIGDIGDYGIPFKRAHKIVLGVEKLLSMRMDLLRGVRVGLVCNQASVNHDFQHVADLFHAHAEINLTTLFGPQHGIRGDVQDNMVETTHAVDKRTNLPVYSLYSETREPTEEMLENVDALVFDMQDVGCRIYTFIYTLANCMRAAKKYGKKVIVCDRPNPINGKAVAGTVLNPAYASFVGQFPLATRHGMTVCELARLFKETSGLDCELELILMDGWERDLWMNETDAPWVLPSPNMPTLETATVFPGTVHLEGTQLSEGRGTTRPFELIGAPFIEAYEYASELNKLNLAGVYFRACYFQPTFQKHARQTCGGVQLHVTERNNFEPVLAGVAAVKIAYSLHKKEFLWKEPPYEYVYDQNPFDIIAGTNDLREAIEREATLEAIKESWRQPLTEFMNIRSASLCY
ncbi:MAG: exo-beta-N-acetylmuramidase NamZ domain-containing protein [Pyrinomonadaceae bacterium]